MRPQLPLLFLNTISFVSSLSSLVHERRVGTLRDAFDRQRIERDVLLPMKISLRQSKSAVLNSEAWLMAVSDPESAQYGQFWSREAIHKAFEPSEEALNAVTAWLAEHGIDHYTRSENRQWLVFNIPVLEAENLLQTQFFEHRDSKGRFKVCCDEYFLPASLREHIDFVSPGVVIRDFTGLTQRSREHLRSVARKKPPSPHTSPEMPPYPLRERDPASSSIPHQPYPTASFPQRRPPFAPDDLTHCYRTVTPACIRALYGFDSANPNQPVSGNNSVGIFEEWSLTYQGDLNKFFEYYTDIPPYTAPIYDSIDGAIIHPNQTRGWRKKYKGPISWLDVVLESTLDIEVAYPIVWPQTVTVFETDDWYWESHESLLHGQFNDFLDGIDGSYCRYTAANDTKGNSTLFPSYPDPRPHGYKGKLQCGAFKPTNVISISYGIFELWVSRLWQERECLEFLKLGLQGVSVFVASGDSGVGYCFQGPIGDRLFNPGTPSACPWITSVGGTRIQENHSVYDPEVAVHGVYYREGWSGGGFSLVFERPSYQEQAVSSYFERANLDIPYFTNGQYQNSTGRYNRNGRGFPDIAAVAVDIATVVLGDYYPAQGTSASTPLIAALFNRIIEERIRVGKGPLGFINPALYKNVDALNDVLQGNNRGPCSQGFKCIEGWDPVTGLGTPDYPKLLEVFLNLP